MAKKIVREPPDPRRIEIVDEAVAAILRQKTVAERIAIASDAHDTARALVTAQVCSQHPDWTPEEIQREVARRLTREAD